MIGISIRSRAICLCISMPFVSRREIARIMQFGTGGLGRARNSSADANVSGCHPWERISSSSDAQTGISSSTTKTMGVRFGIASNPRV